MGKKERHSLIFFSLVLGMKIYLMRKRGSKSGKDNSRRVIKIWKNALMTEAWRITKALAKEISTIIENPVNTGNHKFPISLCNTVWK